MRHPYGALAVLVLSSAVVLAAVASEAPAGEAQRAAELQRVDGRRPGHRNYEEDNGDGYDFERYDEHRRYRHRSADRGAESPKNPGPINLKFVERFKSDLVDDGKCPDGYPDKACTITEVDIICNPAKKKQRGAFFTDYKDNAVSGDLVIQDTPKSKAIGTMKTCSQVFPADLWHQVEIGQQQGFQVGRINGDITFAADAGSCSTQLSGAQASFSVPIYAMIGKTYIPVTPSVIPYMAKVARAPELPGEGCQGSGCLDPSFDEQLPKAPKGSAKVQVASVGVSADSANVGYGKTVDGLDNAVSQMQKFAKDSFYKVRDRAKEDFYKLKGMAKEDLWKMRGLAFDEIDNAIHHAKEGAQAYAEKVRDKVANLCAITFIARGNVTVTSGSNKYTGAIESVLLWDKGVGLRQPRFLSRKAPLELGVEPVVELSLLNTSEATEDLLLLGSQCFGPDEHTVPVVDPASIKLVLSA